MVTEEACSHLNASYRFNILYPCGGEWKYSPPCLLTLPSCSDQLLDLIVRMCLELGAHVLHLLEGAALVGMRMGTSFSGDIQGVPVGLVSFQSQVSIRDSPVPSAWKPELPAYMQSVSSLSPLFLLQCSLLQPSSSPWA